MEKNIDPGLDSIVDRIVDAALSPMLSGMQEFAKTGRIAFRLADFNDEAEFEEAKKDLLKLKEIDPTVEVHVYHDKIVVDGKGPAVLGWMTLL